MVTPGPPITPPGLQTPPPSDNAQVPAWILGNQQANEATRPPVIPPPVVIPVPPSNGQGLPVPAATQSQHPKWINVCPECNAQVNWPCVGPSGQSLPYIHGPRQVLNAQS